MIFWMRSEKNKEVLTFEKFVFIFCNTGTNDKIYWRCSTSGCKVTATTVGRVLFELKGEHYHSNDKEKIFQSQLRDVMKRLVANEPFRPAQEIYDCAKEELANLNSHDCDIAHLFPSFDSVKTNIYRWKSAVAPSGRFISEDTFDFNFFKISEGRDMLLHVEFDDAIVIMGDLNYIRNFTAARNFNIAMDGTFKSSSTSFFQIYIIHGTFSGQFFPLLYGFL
ncbi:hypothetical protein NGRA_3557, partial [Nosema granulosis]